MVIMLIAMLEKRFIVKLLSIALGYALVIGLLPISNYMVSMQTMQMDAATTSQIAGSITSIVHGSASENSTGSCCDAIAPFSVGCAFLAPQYTYIAPSGGSKRVVNSNPVVQSIYIQAVIPPPKA